MKIIKGFVKKYWITVLIFAGLVLLYYYVADVKMLNPYLFPTTEKIAAAFESNKEVMLTERGVTFGYHDLIVDYRGIPEMQTFGYPVILDVTHSLQQPNQSSGVTGGMPQLIETVAKAGVAVGVDGLFMETHEDPSVAKSDGANMLKLDLLEDLLVKLVRIRHSIL